MKKTIKAVSLLMCGVMLLTTGCSYIFPTEEEPLIPPLVAPTDIIYTTTPVVRGDMIQNIYLPGKVFSSALETLAFQAHGGYLKEFNIISGMEVKKGDVLARLDTATTQDEIRAAELALERAKINLQEAGGGTDDQLKIQEASLAVQEQQELINLMRGNGNSQDAQLAITRAEITLRQAQQALYQLTSEPQAVTAARVAMQQAEQALKQAQASGIQADIDAAQAAFNTAKDAYAQAYQSNAPSMVQLDAARLAVQEGEINLRKVKSQYSSPTGDKIELEKAELKLKQLQQELDRLQTGGTAIKGNVEQQMAALTVKDCENRLVALRRQFEESTIVAKFDGVVIAQNFEKNLGDYVSMGEEMGVVADTSNLLIQTGAIDPKYVLNRYQYNTDTPLDSNNTEKQFIIPAVATLGTKKYKGELVSNTIWDEKIKSTVGDVTKIQQSNGGFYFQFKEVPPEMAYNDDKLSYHLTGDIVKELYYGAVISINIEYEKRENVLMVPLNALILQDSTAGNKDDKTQFATVSVLKDGVRISKTITLGLRNDTMAEVTEGLSEGDEIVLK